MGFLELRNTVYYTGSTFVLSTYCILYSSIIHLLVFALPLSVYCGVIHHAVRKN